MLRGPVRGGIVDEPCTLDLWVQVRPGVRRTAKPGEEPTHVRSIEEDEFAPVSRARLDLRDETARAHAAMPYTATSWPGRTNAGNVPMGCEVACWIASRYHDTPHARVLCRMRCMDPSVTVAEARAALDWAHAASGGGGE
jgi:hypothetical protein